MSKALVCIFVIVCHPLPSTFSNFFSSYVSESACACLCIRVCVCVRVCVYLCTLSCRPITPPPYYFSFLLVFWMTSFWTSVFILENLLIQFGCLLLVCPLLCFFLVFIVCLSFMFYLTKTLSVESVRLYFSHRLSSIGEYIFQVVFLTCLPHQQLLVFSTKSRFEKNSSFIKIHISLKNVTTSMTFSKISGQNKSD